MVNLQGKSSCQHNKICGHSFLLIRSLYTHHDKKQNAPHFFYRKKFFLRENPCIALQKAN